LTKRQAINSSERLSMAATLRSRANLKCGDVYPSSGRHDLGRGVGPKPDTPSCPVVACALAVTDVATGTGNTAI